MAGIDSEVYPNLVCPLYAQVIHRGEWVKRFALWVEPIDLIISLAPYATMVFDLNIFRVVYSRIIAI